MPCRNCSPRWGWCLSCSTAWTAIPRGPGMTRTSSQPKIRAWPMTLTWPRSCRACGGHPRGGTLPAILRSWEDRFGARVIDVGYADLRLFVERPPRTLEAAQRVAAEHVFLASDCLDGCRSIPDLAPLLVNAPIWTFWWD